jgi:hypothetical protein
MNAPRATDSSRYPWLMAAAALNALAALLHLGCIVFGAPWYRFFGAGEGIARLAEAGSAFPAVVTAGIAAVLLLWSGYALSGAGVLRGWPLLRPALGAITAIYLARGLAGIPLALLDQKLGRSAPFWAWSSAICVVIGLVHLIGIRTARSGLGART